MNADGITQREYLDDMATAVLNILRENMPSDYFKNYFDSELGQLDSSQLPCVMIRENSCDIDVGASGTDDLEESVTIIVCMDTKDDFGSDNYNSEHDYTGYRMRKLIKGQDPTTGEYYPNTIMRVLRQYFTLDQTLTDNKIKIEYDNTQRNEDLFCYEAYITITGTRIATVYSRT